MAKSCKRYYEPMRMICRRLSGEDPLRIEKFEMTIQDQLKGTIEYQQGRLEAMRQAVKKQEMLLEELKQDATRGLEVDRTRVRIKLREENRRQVTAGQPIGLPYVPAKKREHEMTSREKQTEKEREKRVEMVTSVARKDCLLYTSDAADEV